jgi:membrane protein
MSCRETSGVLARYRSMSFLSRSPHAGSRSKFPWLTGLALVTTYALASALERAQGPRAAGPDLTGHKGFWKHVLTRTSAEIVEDRLLALAAGVVFYGLLALFPAITALVSSYGLFARAATITEHLDLLQGLMPGGAYSIVEEQVMRIVASGTGGLSFTFFFGLAFAMWSANAGIKAIIDALNVIYGVKERRSFLRLNLVSLAFTAGTLVAMLMAIASIVVLPIVLSYLPLFGYGETLMVWLRWPALLLMVVVGLGLLYRFGPNRDNPRWQLFSPGTVFAAAAWLAGSAVLSWYLGNFANYDATYGSLGAGIGLMMWLWMSAIVVLVGAELNSEIDAAKGLVERGAPDKIGGV